MPLFIIYLEQVIVAFPTEFLFEASFGLLSVNISPVIDFGNENLEEFRKVPAGHNGPCLVSNEFFVGLIYPCVYIVSR